LWFGGKGVWPVDNPISALNGYTGVNGTSGFRINGTITNELAGAALAVGDMNADGKADIGIGGSAQIGLKGAAYLVYGATNASWPLGRPVYTLDATVTTGLTDGIKGFKITGIANGDAFGQALAMGDVNGDSITDLLVGAPGLNSGRGNVYSFYGKKSAWTSPFPAAALDGNNGFILKGVSNNDRAGSSLVTGDVNGDGIDDMIIGAFISSYGAVNAGSVYVVYGKNTKRPKISTLTSSGVNGFRINSNQTGNLFGMSISVADINGDGIDDMLISAPYNSDSGEAASGSAYIIFGANSGLDQGNALASYNNGTRGFQLMGGVASAFAGTGIAIGDWSGDGINDITMGAPNDGDGTLGIIFGYKGHRAAFGTVYQNPTQYQLCC
jgi:hypothetical protein